MPRFLTAGEFAGNKISNNARILYALLLDRHRISVKNNWFDDNGEVYIYFKREEMESQTGLSKVTVLKVMQELKDFQLVEERKQGFNKPNKIYLLSPIIGNDENPDPYLDPAPDYNPEAPEESEFAGGIDSTLQEVQELYPRTQRNYTPESIETIPPGVQNLYPNDNKLNNNKKNDNHVRDNEGRATAANGGRHPPAATVAAAIPPNGSRKPVDVPFQEIMELYNSICHRLRSITSIKGNRRTQAAALYEDLGIDGIKALFERASQSAFLCGGGERGWQADFDWLIAPDNMQKVFEGKYDNEPSIPHVVNHSDNGGGFLYVPTGGGVVEMPINPHYPNSRNKNGINTMGILQQMLAEEQGYQNTPFEAMPNQGQIHGKAVDEA
jgi:hypothetical protein